MHLEDRSTCVPRLAILLLVAAGNFACGAEAGDSSDIAVLPGSEMSLPFADVVGAACPAGTVEWTSCGSADARGNTANVVAPPLEVCWTDCVPLAVSCDPDAAGATVHSLSFAKPEDQQQYGVAIDVSGNAILAGTTRHPISGAYSIEIHAVNPAGVILWSQVQALSFWSRITASTDAAGNVLVASNQGLLKLDASGKKLWWRAVTAGWLDPRVAVDAAGNVFYGGSFYNTFDFGLGSLTSGGAQDIYLAKLDPSGNLLWNKRFGAADPQVLEGIAVDPAGSVALTGYFKKSLSFGGGTLNSAVNSAFLAKLDTNGAHLWSKAFVGTSPLISNGIGVDAGGNLAIGGILNGSADFGGGPLASAGSHDVFVAKFDSLGTHLWSQRFGDAHPQYATGVAVNPGGDVVIIGANMGFGEEGGIDEQPGIVDFGGGALVGDGTGIDVFVAKLAAFGGHVYSKMFGGPTNEWSNSVALGADGSAVIAYGLNAAPVDFCLGPVSAVQPWDQVLVRFAP
jgi:hypothetical protein